MQLLLSVTVSFFLWAWDSKSRFKGSHGPIGKGKTEQPEETYAGTRRTESNPGPFTKLYMQNYRQKIPVHLTITYSGWRAGGAPQEIQVGAQTWCKAKEILKSEPDQMCLGLSSLSPYI